MKKIKIIVGTFGYMPEGANSVQLKDAKSEPFDVSDALADKLLKKGIAELTEEAPDVVVSYDDKMTKAQLAEIGRVLGVNLGAGMSKNDMLAALDTAVAAADAPEDPEGNADGEDPEDPEDPESGADGEAPPTVSAADPA